MDFELTDDQVALRDVARDVLAKECPTTLVRSVLAGSTDDDRVWNALVALEWPGLTVPVEHGGSGAGALELALLHEELGSVADPTPFLATTSQYVPLVRACFDDARQADLLGAVCTGGSGAAAFSVDTVTAVPAGDGWRLAGTARFVLDGDRADRIAVVASTGDGPGVFVVDGSSVDALRLTTFDGALHVADLTLDGVAVPADRAATGLDVAVAVARATEEAVTGMAAATVGACQRIFDLVLGHVRERHQFGVPIGSFQAVKHMVVDLYVAVERARALCHFAARTIDEDDDRRTLAASMAKAAAGDAQRIATKHGIQLFGGLGYTWENDLQLFVRRSMAGDLLLGTGTEHRARVARSTLAKPISVTLSFDAAAEALRDELSTWLDEHLPDPADSTERRTSSAHAPDWLRRLQRDLFDAGWLVPGNPREHGGRNAALLEQFVVAEEMGRRNVEITGNPQGLGIIVPSILAFGTEEQKQRWALPILRGEMTAALGMSEPDAGSDLAGLRTRAALDGDHFVVNGQKVWTSGAHHADVIFTFVRTNPDAPKHKGISVLLIPTDLPGVTRRPFGSIISPDELDFNEVFFDDVSVPAENLVGPLHDGWRVATGSLGHERAMLWLGFAERLDTMIEFGRASINQLGVGGDALVLDGYGQLVVDTLALRLLGFRTLAQAQKGMEAPQQSILKLLGSEAALAASQRFLEMLGPHALDPATRPPDTAPLVSDRGTGSWFDLYLRSFPGTIAGGTSQIQRNIVAERVLGLPR